MSAPQLITTGRAFVFLALLLAAGCATKPKTATNYYFFPPPPDEPRVQYLMSFGSEKDLGGRSKLSEFVAGADKEHRPIWKPYGLCVRKGKIYVCDTQAHNVSITDLDKLNISYLKPDGQAAMKLPIGIAVDDDGTRYVTDTTRCQILIYGEDNSFLGEMGKKGEMKPCGIAISGDHLIVTDLSNHCVRVYNKANRELLFTFPKDSKEDKEKLFSPTNIAIDKDGNICVADTGGFNIKIYDPKGKHLRTIGEMGLETGRFALPKGVGVDREGRVYVVDAATSVVQMFDKEGKLLMFFGEPKSSGAAALYLPATLAIDYENVGFFQKYAAKGYTLDHLIFVTNQAGSNKVSVYGFLRKT